ncbi:MAG: hypothetical protein LQ352_003100 [Teloschistes flavicans]|nr:MAG: hypothetical protein LQ352_003100 [Teloschistes flavicans]
MNIGSWADDLQKPGEGAAADSDDTRYGKVWSDVISKWTYANRRSYRSADVLLLCWEHAVIKPDIERLASVFDLSRARVQCQYLRLKPGQWTQDCLNDHISPFVERCRREKSPLVIVYYAGHGQPGGTFDTSGLLGLDLETYLKKTSLADHFTRAFIEALEGLLVESPLGRFTIEELIKATKAKSPQVSLYHTTIEWDPAMGFPFRTLPFPYHFHPDRVRAGPKPSEAHEVTLQLDFVTKPSQEQLKTLALELNGVFNRNTLGVTGVQWKGMAPVMKPSMANGKDEKSLLDL